jgi:hypothetical protein
MKSAEVHSRQKHFFILLVLLCIFIPNIVLAAENNGKITGCYSDMWISEESGDVGGTEIFIVGAGSAYFALIQVAEGEPSAPQLVSVKIANNSINFTMADFFDENKKIQFKGTITAKKLKGTFTNGTEIELKKKLSFWQE